MSTLTNKKSVGAILGEYGAFIALALLVVVLMIFADGFATSSNLLNLLRLYNLINLHIHVCHLLTTHYVNCTF